MSAFTRLLRTGPRPGEPLRILAASGQLGYGIPERAFREGLARRPHVIGCDMGSIDVGPYYLGAGVLATSDHVTRRDLRLVLEGARASDTPLVIGSAGTAGAAPHLDHTLALVREIAAESTLSFKLAVIRSDIPRDLLVSMVKARRTRPLGDIPALTPEIVERAAEIVGQMGVEAFIRAMEEGPDVIIAGRACDTAVFACVPFALGHARGSAMHMAKIIECTSICCMPGGRDAMLGTLEGDAFVLESMNPERAATPLSVAAHSLYEQADPLTVHEPEGVLHVGDARFEAVDDRRTRVSGARWEPTDRFTVKIEGSEWVGERAVMLAGSCDPKVIEMREEIIAGVRRNVSDILPSAPGGLYDLHVRVYGTGATDLFESGAVERRGTAPEVFFLVDCVAERADLAKAVVGVTKQYLLHHGFPGRLSTGGNIAFPFTPPEMSTGAAYRFSVYHLMDCDDLAAVFPVSVERIGEEQRR